MMKMASKIIPVIITGADAPLTLKITEHDAHQTAMAGMRIAMTAHTIAHPSMYGVVRAISNELSRLGLQAK